MQKIFLTKYSVKGVKALDKLISLSFHLSGTEKRSNIKAIYGPNGSGKSGIIASAGILQSLLVDDGYLTNPFVQECLDSIVNKVTEKLFIEVEYVAKSPEKTTYLYSIAIKKDNIGKYTISHEKLLLRNNFGDRLVFESANGELVSLGDMDDFDFLFNKTRNLLSTASFCAVYSAKKLDQQLSTQEINSLQLLGQSLYVYEATGLNTQAVGLYPAENSISKNEIAEFRRDVTELCQFLRIFKPDLKMIAIDSRESYNSFICDLIMDYGEYKIEAKNESSGIQRLIELFMCLKNMCNGKILFVDDLELDLHSVYLSALVEYLLNYVEGQMCFTTHDISLMDVLKQNDIDYLSEDHRLYAQKNGIGYLPSNLYKDGMIEDSQFNVDTLDFLGVFS